MSTRRRAKRKSIGGNISDIDRRLRSLEARPYPKKLSSKVVATKNVALRAVEEQLLADSAITKRTIAESQVVTAALSKVDDEDGAAVTTDTIAPSSITTDKIENLNVTDEKIETLSAEKLREGEEAGINTERLLGEVQSEQIAGLDTEKLIGLVVDDQLETVSGDKLIEAGESGLNAARILGELEDDQIAGMSSEKLIGDVLDGQIASLSAAKITESEGQFGINTERLIGQITNEQIEGIEGSKIVGGLDGDLIIQRSIPAIKLEFNSITEDELQSDSVTVLEIAENSVWFGAYVDYSIEEIKIDDLAIARRHLQDSVITTRTINNGAVTSEKIGNLQVTTGKIANLNVTGEKIADNTITSTKISSSSYGPIVVGGLQVGTGLNKSTVSGGSPTAGDAFISVNFGTGLNEVARGNHTHSGGGTVPSHTHPATLSFINGSTTANSGTDHRHGYNLISGVTVNAPSSIKFKENIEDYTIDTSKLLNLKLKKYKYKRSYKNMHPGREWMYGYMAEDLLEAGMEEVLGYDKDGNPNSVNYGLLSVFIVELLKEQQNKIDFLTKEVERLKDKK